MTQDTTTESILLYSVNHFLIINFQCCFFSDVRIIGIVNGTKGKKKLYKNNNGIDFYFLLEVKE